MAIKIPILTSFDPKGLKQANAAFAGLQTSIGSLGRNFAVFGAGITASTALLSKAVMSASNFEAEFEGVNQVFKDAAGSVQAFADAAAKTAGLSATEALQASKTFGLFATGAGLSVDAAAQFSTTMVQLAGDLGSFNDVPTAEALAAIQSGLMGQAEPLRKFGVFLDDARLKQEAMNMGLYDGDGALSTQAKMMASYSAILSQTTVQQGDFVKYGDTLGNQLKTISSDFQNLTKDIGMMLIPVITAAMPQIKEMATSIGTQLKNAIGSIDWKATIQAVVNFTNFLVANATAIAQVVAAIFILNTAFKLMTVASGIVKVAIALQTWVTAQLASGMTLATVATNILSAAMRMIPFVAIAGGLFVLIDTFNRTRTAILNTAPALGAFQTNTIAAANSAATFSPYLNILKQIIGGLIAATGAADTLGIALTRNQILQQKLTPRQADEAIKRAGLEFVRTPQFSMPDFSSLLSSTTGGGDGGAALNAELDKLTKEAEKAAKEAAKAMQQIEDDAQAQREQSLAQEREVLDQRVNAYESFADSVKQLFGQIKDSIMSSFELPKLGNSVNSITKNIGKLLEKTKGFANNISKLAGLGLNSTLLQQVIGAGPMAGSQLASALVGGGSAFISQLNSAYGEFGGLASGIAGAGTTAAFGSQATINNYNIEVNGGMATGSDIGRAVVNAIKDYERQSGAAWRA
jgi:hypothetical protein